MLEQRVWFNRMKDGADPTAMRHLYLRAASLACLLSGWMSLPGQSLTPTVMSPAQVAISQPLSSGKDMGPDKNKIRVHGKLPDHGGTATSGPDGALQTNLGPLINAAGGTHFDGVGAN